MNEEENRMKRRVDLTFPVPEHMTLLGSIGVTYSGGLLTHDSFLTHVSPLSTPSLTPLCHTPCGSAGGDKTIDY